MFGFPLSCASNGGPIVWPKQTRFMVNARSCIYAILQAVQAKALLLPSHFCASILQPIQKLDLPFSFYALDDQLYPQKGALNHVRAGDVVLLIDFFGFDRTPMQLAKELKDRGAIIIQDASQALLSTFGRPLADFIIHSPRKTLGVPGGGVLVTQAGLGLQEVELAPPPVSYLESASHAYLARSRFDRGVQDEFYPSFQASESNQPCGLFAMDPLSLGLLNGAFDPDAIAERRKLNYRVLAAALADFALFGVLERDVVPLGFPVLLRNRDEVQRKLADESIFCPIHWPQATPLPTGFQSLSAVLLTLVVDQRASSGGLERTIEIVLREGRPL